MGLDQYAYIADGRKIHRPVEFIENNCDKGWKIDPDFWYWRKNRQLQGWMERLYRAKCAECDIDPEEFNCSPMLLEEDDILDLIATIKAKTLPDSHGFFWGDGDYDDDTALEDLEFCKKALEEIHAGNAIVYDCWW